MKSEIAEALRREQAEREAKLTAEQRLALALAAVRRSRYDGEAFAAEAGGAYATGR